MELIRNKEGRNWQLFDNVTDLLNFVTDPAMRNMESPYESRHVGRAEFFGSNTWDDAIKLAREGWPDGLAEIVKFVVSIEKLVMTYIPEPVIHYDVVGDVIDMGRYLQGDPECVMSLVSGQNVKKIAQGKIIHLVANIDANAGVSIYTFFRRGAATVALIDALECAGRRVIVDAVSGLDDYECPMETLVRVKNADERIQLDKMAFLFAHPSVCRRILFAAWERMPTDMCLRYGVDKSLRYGRALRNPKTKGDIYIDYSFDRYNTEELITEYVLDQLKKQGVVLKEKV